MAFPQNKVGMAYAAGVAGDKATLNPCVYLDYNPLAAEDSEINVGNFCFDAGDHLATHEGTANEILGFVQRNLSYSGYGVGASLQVPEGFALNVVRNGDMFAVSSTVATVGQKVFASLTDGSISTGAEGAAIAGAAETAWWVSEGGAVGDLIVISCW